MFPCVGWVDPSEAGFGARNGSQFQGLKDYHCTLSTPSHERLSHMRLHLLAFRSLLLPAFVKMIVRSKQSKVSDRGWKVT